MPAVGRSLRLAGVWPWLVIALASFLAFLPSLQNQFTNWDDNVNLTDNPFLVPPTWWGFAQLWRAPYENLYVPLFYTSYYIDLLFSGGRPNPFITHFINVLLHVACAVLAASVIRRLWLRFEDPQSRAADRADWLQPLPWLAGGLVFALHPLQTEVVAWATGRKDLVAAILCLTAWVCWVRAWESPPPRAGRLRRIAFGFFVAALFAKPASVALPAALLAVDWFAERPPIRELARRYVWWFAAALLGTLATAGSQEISAQGKAALTPLWTRPFVATDALCFYVAKIVWPLHLAAVYNRVPVAAIRSPIFWWSLPIVTVCLALLWRRRTVWGLAAALFIVFLAPVLGLVPFAFQRYSTVADRYVYLSMVGVGLAACAAIARIRTRWPRLQPALAGLVAVIALACGTLSWRQSRVWYDSISLWSHNVRVVSSSAVAHANLAAEYALRSRNDEAIEHNRLALQFDPQQERALSNLGLLLAWKGETTAALELLHRAVKLRPGFADPYSHIGDCYLRQGKIAEAADFYRQALDRDLRNVKATLGLSYCYYLRRRFAEAEQILRDGLAARPTMPALWVGYGHFLSELGRTDEAKMMYRRALDFDPQNQDALARLRALGVLPPAPGDVPPAQPGQPASPGAPPVNSSARPE
jgi:Tfp pilus assembly protein PilF